jgi:hypothetical protein
MRQVWRTLLGLVLGSVFFVPTVQAGKVPRRPKGITHTEAVAQAVELLVLSDQYGWSVAGAIESGRALVRDPKADAERLSLMLWRAAYRWSLRGTPEARRVFDLLKDPPSPAAARALAGAQDDLASQIAAMMLVDGCMHTIAIAGSLPFADAHLALARCADADSAAVTLTYLGPALNQLNPQTQLGRDLVASWRLQLAEVRIPAELGFDQLPALSDGQPVTSTPAILRVTASETFLSYRPVLSVVDLQLLVNRGPPAEPLVGDNNNDAVLRWNTIANRRRASLERTELRRWLSVGALESAPQWLAAADQDAPYRRVDNAIAWVSPESRDGATQVCWLGHSRGRETMQCFERAEQTPDGAFYVSLPDPDPDHTRVELLSRQGQDSAIWIVPSDDTSVAEVSRRLSDLRALGLTAKVARSAHLPELADATEP